MRRINDKHWKKILTVECEECSSCLFYNEHEKFYVIKISIWKLRGGKSSIKSFYVFWCQSTKIYSMEFGFSEYFILEAKIRI